MTDTSSSMLTSSLEDYLETIHEIAVEGGPVRVREIASRRSVKPGSVSPALKRLSSLGFIDYGRRDHIELTEAGAEVARRVAGRHRLLSRFLTEVLGLDGATADADACAMEHAISATTMERLVRFFEFTQACPRGREDFLSRLRACPVVQGAHAQCQRCQGDEGTSSTEAVTTVDRLQPGEGGVVRRVGARGAVRQRLLDMGMLPGASLGVVRKAPGGDPIWIDLEGSHLALRRSEAATVEVTRR